jgi:hypothetical protein
MKNPVFWDVTPRDLERTDISEVIIALIIRVTGVVELGTRLRIIVN